VARWLFLCHRRCRPPPGPMGSVRVGSGRHGCEAQIRSLTPSDTMLPSRGSGKRPHNPAWQRPHMPVMVKIQFHPYFFIQVEGLAAHKTDAPVGNVPCNCEFLQARLILNFGAHADGNALRHAQAGSRRLSLRSGAANFPWAVRRPRRFAAKIIKVGFPHVPTPELAASHRLAFQPILTSGRPERLRRLPKSASPFRQEGLLLRMGHPQERRTLSRSTLSLPSAQRRRNGT